MTLESTLRQALDQIAQESVGLEEEESLFPIRDAAHQDQVVTLWPDFVGSHYRGGQRMSAARPYSAFLTKI